MVKFYEVSHAPGKVKWPDGSVEEMEMTRLVAEENGRRQEVAVGRVIGGRLAFDEQRARVHVVVDNAVQAEFVGTDDYDSTGLLVSVLKLPGGNKHAKTLRDLPADYGTLKCGTFSQYIRRKGAFNSLAVVARKDDLLSMALYGYLRWKDRRSGDSGRSA